VLQIATFAKPQTVACNYTLIMDLTLLTRLQNWYLINCDGDWEHSYGISIVTLDNPGWAVKIDLKDTSLQNIKYEKNLDNGSFDWIKISVIDQVFQGMETRIN
jgi:hypothetical protein